MTLNHFFEANCRVLRLNRGDHLPSLESSHVLFPFRVIPIRIRHIGLETAGPPAVPIEAGITQNPATMKNRMLVNNSARYRCSTSQRTPKTKCPTKPSNGSNS
jgi:hypothetical protein